MTRTAEVSTETAAVVDVQPHMLAEWLTSNDTVVVDVREDFEHAEQHIEGAVLVPLSKLDCDAIRAAHSGRRIVFHCRSGNRSKDAARRFLATGEPSFQLAGGIEGWKAAGLPVVTPETGPRIPIMRQVQITAGTLVAVGVLLGVTVSPWFLALSAFVGCGLVFAGISGWCGMAMLMARMPWNQRCPVGGCAPRAGA